MKQSRYLSVFDPVITGIRDFIARGSLNRGTLWFDPILKREYEENIMTDINEEKDSQIYQFRRDQWQNLVTVHYVQKNNFLDSNQFKVFTQRIPILLSKILKIKFNQFLFILKQSLIGFQTIKQKYGFIKIKDNMIGLNCLGKVKVWLNSKFQNNNPQISLNCQSHTTLFYQEQMVTSLFDSIERHCQPNQKLLKFQKMKPYKMNFIMANNYIYNFILQQSITVPENLQNIVLQKSSALTKYQKQEPIQKLSYENHMILGSQYVIKSFQSNIEKSGDSFSSKLFSQQNNNSNNKQITEIKFLTSSVQQFQNNWCHKNTKYFRKQGQIFMNKNYEGTKSKDIMTVKSSWTSKDFSFRSTNTSIRKNNNKIGFLQDRKLYKQQRKYFPPSRDQSFMNDSQIPNMTINSTQRTRSQHYPIISNQIQITKSVMINQRQHQIYQNPELNKIKSNKTPLKIDTGHGFFAGCNNSPSTQTTPKKSRNLSSMTQFKTLNRSVIKITDKIQQVELNPFSNYGLLAIPKLKSFYSNKLNDLKKSIISQHINQASEVDPYSPLIIKTRASAIRKGNPSPFFHLTRCNQQQPVPIIIKVQQDYFNKSSISNNKINNKLSSSITNMYQISEEKRQ